MAKIIVNGPNDLMEVLDYLAFDEQNFGKQVLEYLDNSNAPTKLAKAIKKNGGIEFSTFMNLLDDIDYLTDYLFKNGEKPDGMYDAGNRYVYLPACEGYELVEMAIAKFADDIYKIKNRFDILDGDDDDDDLESIQYEVTSDIDNLSLKMVDWLTSNGVKNARSLKQDLVDQIWEEIE